MTNPELLPVPEAYRYDYAGLCWWCGAPANSREHKWKKSEVVKLFGSGSYDGKVLWVHEDGTENIRGPKASSLMFGHSLCRNCNGTRSQPFDRAYSTFSNYLIENHAALLEARILDFTDVFGEAMNDELPKLARYYAKHIGCRIAEHAGRVPDDLVMFLNEDSEVARSVFSQLGIREMLRVNVDDSGETILGLSLRDSLAHHSPVPGDGMATFKSGVGLGAIEFVYDVNLDLGRPNTGNGIFQETLQPLWHHDEDLYNLQIYVADH